MLMGRRAYFVLACRAQMKQPSLSPKNNAHMSCVPNRFLVLSRQRCTFSSWHGVASCTSLGEEARTSALGRSKAAGQYVCVFLKLLFHVGPCSWVACSLRRQVSEAGEDGHRNSYDNQAWLHGFQGSCRAHHMVSRREKSVHATTTVLCTRTRSEEAHKPMKWKRNIAVRGHDRRPRFSTQSKQVAETRTGTGTCTGGVHNDEHDGEVNRKILPRRIRPPIYSRTSASLSMPCKYARDRGRRRLERYAIWLPIHVKTPTGDLILQWHWSSSSFRPPEHRRCCHRPIPVKVYGFRRRLLPSIPRALAASTRILVMAWHHPW
jgi:hypothetical protein